MTDRKICEARCYLGTAIAALMNLFHLPDGRTLSDSDVIEILFLVVLTSELLHKIELQPSAGSWGLWKKTDIRLTQLQLVFWEPEKMLLNFERKFQSFRQGKVSVLKREVKTSTQLPDACRSREVTMTRKLPYQQIAVLMGLVCDCHSSERLVSLVTLM